MSTRTVAIVVENVVENIIIVSAEHVLAAGEIEYTDANPAGIGWQYDGTGFIPPQPFPSWILNGYVWEPPTPIPANNAGWIWDEPTTSWINV